MLEEKQRIPAVTFRLLIFVGGSVTRRFARIFAYWDSSDLKDCPARKSTHPGLLARAGDFFIP